MAGSLVRVTVAESDTGSCPGFVASAVATLSTSIVRQVLISAGRGAMKSFSTAVNGVEERPFTNADTNFLQSPWKVWVRLISASPND